MSTATYLKYAQNARVTMTIGNQWCKGFSNKVHLCHLSG